ncbi:MAG: DNA-3-methyladenine glycosylase family protein [Candidatus Helarchaeota archaeon]
MKIPYNLFDLQQTLCCGQVFRWKLGSDHWWYGIVKDRIIKIRQKKEFLEFNVFPKMANSPEFITSYFRLDDNLELIYKQIGKDDHIRKAIQAARGLRLIRQDPWECLISFMISQNNQIPKIRRSIESLAAKFGILLNFEGKDFYTFPTPEQLSNANLRELRDSFDKGGCALGYRAKYVLSTALLVHNNSLEINLDDLKKLPYADAHKWLQDSFCGVGPKVADCVLLFALEKLEACPLDTWIRKIITNLYFDRKKMSDNEIKKFCTKYFGNFAGYAQEYLYCHRLELSS